VAYRELAWSALGVLSISFGAPLITVVALKPIAAEFGNIRSVPALSYSLAWLGSAAGGIVMGLVAEQVGVRWTVIFGVLMIAAGLLLSSLGGRFDLYLGHGLFMGLLGNAGINAPLYVYVARWFDRRRGTALALIASGQAAAGTILAPLFGRTIEWFGWRHTMQIYAVFAVVVIIPVAFLVFRSLPKTASTAGGRHEPIAGALILGLRARTAFAFLCLASFLCCVPMAMPQGQRCWDSRYPRQRDVVGAFGLWLYRPPTLGFHRRSDRWTTDSAHRLGLPGHSNDRVFAHSGRSRPFRGFCSVRSGVQRDHPGLCAGAPRALPVQRSVVASADLAALQRLGHGGRRLACRRDL
jgi:MFS family permease